MSLFFPLPGMYARQYTSPTGRMIQGHTVIMFKDTDSAQFSLVKLEQSVLESERILFCGCLVLLKEPALPWLVTTCWRGWEWFREGSWITEILFIYSESPLFLQVVLSLQLLGFMAIFFFNCVKQVWLREEQLKGREEDYHVKKLENGKNVVCVTAERGKSRFYAAFWKQMENKKKLERKIYIGNVYFSTYFFFGHAAN